MHYICRAALAASVFLTGSSAALAAPLLAVDFDDRTAVDTPNNPAGFSSFVLPGTTATVTSAASQVIGGYTVTLTPFDDGLDENLTTAGDQNTPGAIDDRDRATPTDGGALTYAQLYDDVIFAGGSTGFTGGMSLSVSGGALQPNTQYFLSIYAFDAGSNTGTQPRAAAWTDSNNANAPVLVTSFNGNDLPTTNDQYRFTGLVTTDAAGAINVLGRNAIPLPTAGGPTFGVFINGFEINAVPEPASLSIVGLAALATLRRRRA